MNQIKIKINNEKALRVLSNMMDFYNAGQSFTRTSPTTATLELTPCHVEILPTLRIVKEKQIEILDDQTEATENIATPKSLVQETDKICGNCKLGKNSRECIMLLRFGGECDLSRARAARQRTEQAEPKTKIAGYRAGDAAD